MLSDMLRPEQRQTLMQYLEELRQKQQGQTPQTMNTPTDLPAQPLPQPPAPTQPPQTAQDVVGPDFSDEARKKMLEDANRTKPGQVVGDALAGFGDALARSYGGDAGSRHLQGALDQQNLDQKRKVEQFNQGREQKTQNYTLGQQIIKNNRENQNTQELMDPASNVSKANMALLRQLDYKGPDLPALHAELLAKDYLEKHKADVEEGYKQFNLQRELDQQQNSVEQNARQAIQSLRGDPSLADAELKRDAAISAFNRIHQVEQRGETLNPIDYVDILGQIYKARTGSAPSQQVLEEAHQNTAKGSLGKVYTYFTGQQAPATTQAIMKSLKDMAKDMGMQADKMHEGYMKTHLIKPKGLTDDRWEPIARTGRGTSFAEATGQNSEAGDQPAQVMTATNKKTGERIQSSDGGKTWQPVK